MLMEYDTETLLASISQEWRQTNFKQITSKQNPALFKKVNA